MIEKIVHMADIIGSRNKNFGLMLVDSNQNYEEFALERVHWIQQALR